MPQKKKRAGGGRPPQGSQSAARPLWVGATACQTPPHRSPRPRQSKCRQYICLKSLAGVSFRPPISPQEPRAFRRAAPKSAPCRACFRFKFRSLFPGKGAGPGFSLCCRAFGSIPEGGSDLGGWTFPTLFTHRTHMHKNHDFRAAIRTLFA